MDGRGHRHICLRDLQAAVDLARAPRRMGVADRQHRRFYRGITALR